MTYWESHAKLASRMPAEKLEAGILVIIQLHDWTKVQLTSCVLFGESSRMKLRLAKAECR